MDVLIALALLVSPPADLAGGPGYHGRTPPAHPPTVYETPPPRAVVCRIEPIRGPATAPLCPRVRTVEAEARVVRHEARASHRRAHRHVVRLEDGFFAGGLAGGVERPGSRVFVQNRSIVVIGAQGGFLSAGARAGASAQASASASARVSVSVSGGGSGH